MPPCTEKKILLSGEMKTFACELVHFSKDFGILKYIVDRHYDISGMKIQPGDITSALYWTDRPYTLYVWELNHGKDIAYYFNIADQVSLSLAEFTWRDLAIDILVDSHGKVHTLDEDELPHDLDADLARYIQSAKTLILRGYQAIIKEADAILRKLRP